MERIKIGITGQAGFVGTNLYNYLNGENEFDTIPFEDAYYDDETKLQEFVRRCDVVVHLAAVMRSQEPGYVYQTNMRLVNDLIMAAERTGAKPSILFASSIQESGNTEYARCKRDGATILSRWCEKNHSGFCKMVFPNLFGPHAKPNYSSFIATFCYKLTHNEQPQVLVDNEVPLIYIGALTNQLAGLAKEIYSSKLIMSHTFQPQFTMKVTEVLSILTRYRDEYLKKKLEPNLTTQIEKDLFTTFCSYIDYEQYLPKNRVD